MSAAAALVSFLACRSLLASACGTCDATALLQSEASVQRRAVHRRDSAGGTGHKEVDPGELSYMDLERLPDVFMAAWRLNGTLPRIQEAEDPSELSFADLARLPDQVVDATQDKSFMDSVAEASRRLPRSADRFAGASKNLVAGLQKRAANLSDQELGGLLAMIFHEHVQLAATHQSDATKLSKKIKSTMSQNLTKALGPWLDGMTQHLAIQGSLGPAASAEHEAACEALAPVMGEYAQLHSRVKQVLETTSRGWYGQLKNWGDWRTPYDASEVPRFAVALAKQLQLDNRSSILMFDVVSLCYNELITLEQVSHELMLEVTPLLRKLHCTWNSDSQRGSLHALGVLLALAAGLFGGL